MRIRYIAPAIAPLVILATYGLHRIHSHLAAKWTPGKRRLPAICATGLAAAMLMFNAAYIIHQFKVVDPFSYISGRVDRDTYITRHRPEYTVIQYANRHLAADAKLLVLFMGNRRYYSDRDLVFGSNMFRGIVKGADSAGGVRGSIQAGSFTHLLIRFDLFNQWTDKQFDNKQKRILKEFFARYAKPVISANGYGLFELIDR